MNRFVSLVAHCLFLAGCVSAGPPPISFEESAGFAGKTLAMTMRTNPPFVAMTASKGMFALVGVGVAVAAGNDLVLNKNITDPANAVAQTVAADYGSRYGMKVVEPVHLTSSPNTSELARSTGDTDYILDVASTGWGFNYLPLKLNQFRVVYSAKIRLIDASVGKVLISDTCLYDSISMGKSPVSHEELLANDATYIKAILSDAERYCAQKFISN
ncbi:hypothetical protein LP7551_04164 [Roseibium album]|nr:hypothetical protein LP7551_04164 [Roseibium album]